MFVASVLPVAEGVPAYLAYRQEVEALVRPDQRALGHPGWTPILYDTRDDFPRSVAVLRRADVLLVNPIRDGLNLVAKEGRDRQRARRRAVPVARGGGVGRARRRRRAGAPVRRGRHGRRPRRRRCAWTPPSGDPGRAAPARWRWRAGPADWLADQLAAAGEGP